MEQLIESLRRRRVFRSVAAYTVLAWGGVQVVVTVAPELGWPEWVGRAAIGLALAGLPAVVGLAWAYDLSERGVRRWRVGMASAVALLVAAWVGVGLLSNGDALSAEEIGELVAAARDSADAGQFLAAFDLLDASGIEVGVDPRVDSMRNRVTERVGFSSEPPGADVWIARWQDGLTDPTDALVLLGQTPLDSIALPRARHHVRFELDGWLPAERPLDTSDWLVGQDFPTRLFEVGATLRPVGSSHPEMVAVPGGSYTLVSPDRGPGITSLVDDFLIDRYEVTNEAYAEFVRAGGYADPRFWDVPFVDGIDTLSFSEGMARLVDQTGLPGPRGWSGQEFRTAEADHPVTGVSWYEAAAFARFEGKSLPTVFQWEKAARDGRYAYRGMLMPWGLASPGLGSAFANFGTDGPVAVHSMPFGVSPFGVHALAGNVQEWLRNPVDEGRGATGGSWAGPTYTYTELFGLDPFFSSPSLGFRLVYLESDRQRLSDDQGAGRLDMVAQSPSYDPVPRDVASEMLRYFDYDPVPLDPIVAERVEAAAWIRESLSVEGPYGERIPVHLYVPKRALPPYQTLVYVPSAAAFSGSTVTEDTEWVVGPIVQSGRAVLAVGVKGMVGNEFDAEWAIPDPPSVAFRDWVVRNGVEVRVAVDYLESRPDIDMDRLGYSAFSFGAGSRGALMTDPRFSLAVLYGPGIDERVRPVRPEVDPVTYAPYYDMPMLVVQGLHDEEHPYETRVRPLLELLPDDLVQLELFDGAGHLVPAADRVPVTLDFLREHWGPVR
ncbi:MAG: SUMF1/EgtB/PvdO family nonheme iron enzyme [Gemmatimonadota bacterium]